MPYNKTVRIKLTFTREDNAKTLSETVQTDYLFSPLNYYYAVLAPEGSAFVRIHKMGNHETFLWVFYDQIIIFDIKDRMSSVEKAIKIKQQPLNAFPCPLELKDASLVRYIRILKKENAIHIQQHLGGIVEPAVAPRYGWVWIPPSEINVFLTEVKWKTDYTFLAYNQRNGFRYTIEISRLLEEAEKVNITKTKE